MAWGRNGRASWDRPSPLPTFLPPPDGAGFSGVVLARLRSRDLDGGSDAGGESFGSFFFVDVATVEWVCES